MPLFLINNKKLTIWVSWSLNTHLPLTVFKKKKKIISHISSAFNLKVQTRQCFKTIKVKLWLARLRKPRVLHELKTYTVKKEIIKIHLLEGPERREIERINKLWNFRNRWVYAFIGRWEKKHTIKKKVKKGTFLGHKVGLH